MDGIEIDWEFEKQRFKRVAYRRTVAAAHDAFRKWHRRKRDDAVAEMVGKMWDQWARLLMRGKDPEPMLWRLIYWARMWVRYDRKIAGRGRSPDVFDHRAKMTRQDLDGQGKAHPAERSARINGWIDWAVDARADDPSELAAALEQLGLTSDDLAGQ
jgi:hypothetical protein